MVVTYNDVPMTVTNYRFQPFTSYDFHEAIPDGHQKLVSAFTYSQDSCVHCPLPFLKHILKKLFLSIVCVNVDTIVLSSFLF